MQSAFAAALKFTFGAEGGYQNDYNDPGNWTGGAVGAGRQLGTKYGVSAASYPNLDIPNLTLAEASAIYEKDYWAPINGPALPNVMAIATFDAAVNSGVSRGAKWLQEALGVPADGQIGPETANAAQHASDSLDVALDAIAHRLVFLTGLQLWQTEPLAFARRVVRLAACIGAYRASAPAGAPPAP